MIIDIVLAYAQGRGGLEDVITTVSNNLLGRGYRVRVFQAYRPIHVEWEKTISEIYFYGLKNNLDEDDVHSLALGYSNLIDIMGVPDVIIATHAPVLSLICNLSIRNLKYNKPSILSWIHGRPEYYGMCELLKYSDAHLAISNDIGGRIHNYVEKESNIHYVGNPVRLENLITISQNREKLDLLYIGRLHNKEKRLDILFNALKLLDNSWTLKIIGSGEDEDYLKLLAMYLEIYDNIEWCGWLDKPWESVNLATALILTSDVEGFGLVLVEALGRGIPVISSDCEGPKDIIKEGENGWIFKRGDYNGLYDILQSIQKKQIELPASMKCIESVEKFNINNYIDNLENIISNYIKKEQDILSDIYLLMEENKIEDALEYVTCYNERLRHNIEFLNIKGIIAVKAGEYEIAINNFTCAISKSNKNNIDIYYNLAYAYEKNMEIDNALKIYNLISHSTNGDEKKEVMELIKELEAMKHIEVL
ncbi:glycosyltransferase [Clostridioides difficile]|nr:glycosyltransferase [Clostridioides difficile]